MDADLVRWRRALHEMPEPGFAELETSAYVREVLEGWGLRVQTRAKTGLVAEIAGQGSGPVIALRADMDGLPLTEESGEPFASRHPGMMHACGHDVHIAVLLGAARELLRQADFPGRIRLLFQPSEEGPESGARALIDEGALQGVDGILGLHVWSHEPAGTVAMRDGAMMASADTFDIMVEGRGGHGSEPHTARDAILIASQIVVNLQQITSRRLTPLEPCVVSVGRIEAGSASNIIAESARLSGTVRTFSAAAQETVEREMIRIAAATAAMQRARADVHYHRGVPAVINDRPVIEAWRAALAGIVKTSEPLPAMASEDYSLYLNQVPGAFVFLGGKPEGEVFPHHSPHFRISEECLPVGVETLVRGARALLTHPEVLRRAR